MAGKGGGKAAAKNDPQMHFEEEPLAKILGGEAYEEVVGHLEKYLETKEATNINRNSWKKVKDALPKSDKPRRFRVGDQVLFVEPRTGGQEVSYVTKDGHKIKVED